MNIVDKIDNLNNKNNIVINYYTNITYNIYKNGINIDENENINFNLTFIYLEECEDYLKKFYNLDLNENLYISSSERLNSIENRITNQSKFKIYIKNGTELEDLSACKHIPISIISTISKLDKANYDKAKIFSLQGYDIYNLSSEFYTDICTSAHINGNDIVLKDRIADIYPNNISFCSKGCKLNNINIESKKVNCSCNISYVEENLDISNNKIKLNASDNFFIYLLDSLNYKIFRCYKIILKFKFDDLINNLGFYFGIGFILFNIICIFIFSIYYLNQLRIQIYKLIPNKKILLKKFYLFRNQIIEKEIKIERKSTKNILSNNKTNYIDNLTKQKNRKKIKKRKTNLNKNNTINKKDSDNKIIYIKKETVDNLEHSEEKDYNYLPYSQALKLDKRNFFSIYLSLIKMKIDIISILFYPEEFTHKSLTLCFYALDFLFSFFLNALLYTDDVVSEKYHNNGELNFFTTIFLALTSNIISSIIMYFIQKLVTYREYLSRMVRDANKKYEFILTFKKLYLVLKIKIFFFFSISFILSLFFALYLIIFCKIYNKSQSSLTVNYIIGLIESLAYSVGVSLIICILRFIGLKKRLIHIYRTSVYLDENL